MCGGEGSKGTVNLRCFAKSKTLPVSREFRLGPQGHFSTFFRQAPSCPCSRASSLGLHGLVSSSSAEGPQAGARHPSEVCFPKELPRGLIGRNNELNPY